WLSVTDTEKPLGPVTEKVAPASRAPVLSCFSQHSEPATYTLLASGESPGRLSPVARVRLTPPTRKVVLAWMTFAPAVGLLIWAVTVPGGWVVVASRVLWRLATKVAAPRVIDGCPTVRWGGGPKPVAASPPGAPAARPSSCRTVTVSVWGERIELVAVGGLIC